MTVLVALVACGTAHAALPLPPFDLSVSPARVVEGESATITIRAVDEGTTGARYDIYLVWALSERAAFLKLDSMWSPTAVPYYRGVSPSEFARASTPWRTIRPSGHVPLAMVVVPAGVDPMDRARWTFRPVMRWVTVRPHGVSTAPLTNPLWAAAAAASLIVLVGPGFVETLARRRAREDLEKGEEERPAG
jgi:hypothetical protein